MEKNITIEILNIILNSPLIWLIAISAIVRGFYRKNDKGLMTEEQYYHSLHKAIEELFKQNKEE